MIFVTVGTHEQPFDRLVQYVDELKQKNIIKEDVVIQTGFSTYKPQYCDWSNLFSYQQMAEYVQNARIVITHGGPSSFIAPLQKGKIPIVVPRKRQFDEHVNDHQVEFCREVAKRQKNIILVEDIENLKDIILKYESVIGEMSEKVESNNAQFNKNLENLVQKLILESQER
ncbi:MAG: multidrug MFS transporter [Acetatifactor sp.]|nr:multidrug MFS transporter [Acetatifactor sp.]